MTLREALLDFREGRLSKLELQEKLKLLRATETPSCAPLSDGQKGLWTLYKQRPSASHYNVPICYRLRGTLSMAALEAAWRETAKAHAALRTVVDESQGTPSRRLIDASAWSIARHDVSNWAADELRAHLRKLAHEPFDLARGPLARMHLLAHANDDHILLVVAHHLVVDGRSTTLVIRDLAQRYAQFADDGEAPRVPAAGYDDFVGWEGQYLASARARGDRDYWMQRLAPPFESSSLPAQGSREFRAHVEGRSHVRGFDARFAQRIRAWSREAGIGEAALLLAVFKLLLHRYLAVADVTIGMPTLGRTNERFADVVGYFVNIVAIRTCCDSSAPFQQLAHDVQVAIADALDHADYPFSRVVGDLRSERDPGRQPLFDIAYEYQSASAFGRADRHWQAGEFTLEAENVAGLHQEGEFELVLEIVPHDDVLDARFKYDANVFAPEFIAQIADHYIQLLAQVLIDPNVPLHAYRMLTEAEERRVHETINATRIAYPPNAAHELISAQARRVPQAVAVECGAESLTYEALEAATDRWSQRLRAMGVGEGHLVAVCVDRSIDLIVALLATHKAGAAYVPLDPDFPRERLETMLDDCRACLVLTHSHLVSRLPVAVDASPRVVAMDSAWSEGLPITASRRDDGGEPLAYVIYTSGSTGTPKGVMVSQRALTNCLSAFQRFVPLDTGERLLAITTCSFDIAALELFLPLIAGACCRICSASVARDVHKLRAELEQVRPSLLQATPTTWQLLFQLGWQPHSTLRALCGGEALPRPLREQFLRHGCQAWNVYGPTETTIWSTAQRMDAGSAAAIGAPIANTQVYVLDAQQRLLPPYVAGELCIAGDGLAQGYLGRPELTAERFVPHPFKLGEKLYRTGDLARWNLHGALEYLGRNDSQIKLNGHRIELGEIEAHLGAHPSIARCAVVLAADGAFQRLVAYCVGRGTATNPSTAALREHLRRTMPDYMIPHRFVFVSDLPLTQNLKIDRKALAAREMPASGGETRSPDAGPGTTRLRQLWSELLNREDVALDEGFFDAGGDSVLGVVLAERIARAFDCEFTLTDLFRVSSVRQIAREIDAQRASKPGAAIDAADASTSAEVPAYYERSAAIIGIACRMPGAADLEAFWTNLIDGCESIGRVSDAELRAAGAAAVLDDPRFVPVSSRVEGKDAFDREFFRISRRDAQLMDPQLRLLLQSAWHAVEDAGYTPADIADAGVFVTTTNSEYRVRALQSRAALERANVLETGEEYVSWLLAQPGTAPTMISHRLGLKGASIALHSNCSSSLTALHAALRSLRAGESQHALVGAACLYANDSLGYVHQTGLNFSSDGHVRTFDERADGMVGGEGVAVVLLKLASRAVADGDRIYAIVRDIEINNDGADKTGFYAPSATGQAEVIERVLARGGIDPRTIGYVEAHGTGTAVGDPVELSALTSAYRRYTSDVGFCAIGSVKSNIGHLDTVAGLAGCIKVALGLARGRIPPTINFERPNPRFAFENSPFFVADRALAWPGAAPHRAAVSSFGIGGTNAHAVLEQAPALKTPACGDCTIVVPLSARGEEQLRTYARVLRTYLSRLHHDARAPRLQDVAYTLQVGRVSMHHRAIFVADTYADLFSQLAAFERGAARAVAAHDAGDAQRTAGLTVRQVADAWVKGIDVDWRACTDFVACRRIGLPGYPFAEERISAERVRRAGSPDHPLLQSEISPTEFATQVSAREFFLRDHVIGGRPILPGVTYLEMVRAAAERSHRWVVDVSERRGVRLKNVVWLRPLAVEGAEAQVRAYLTPAQSGIEFVVGAGPDRVSCSTLCQGTVESFAYERRPRIDLAECRRTCADPVDVARAYSDLRSIGFVLGPTFRAIESTRRGVDEEGHPILLAEVALPSDCEAQADRYLLHPSIMDATIGTLPGTQQVPTLPFVLETLDVFAPAPRRGWIFVRYATGSGPQAASQRFDIDLCEASGFVCAQIRGYSRRPLVAEAGEPGPAGVVLYSEEWVEAPRERLESGHAAGHVVLVVDAAAAAPQGSLEHEIIPIDLRSPLQLSAACEPLLARLAAFRRERGRRSAVHVVAAGVGDPIVLGLAAFLKTACVELHGLHVRLTSIADIAALTRVDMLGSASAEPVVERIAATYQRRALRSLEGGSMLPWKRGGRYLITGGTGALGLLLAEEIVRCCAGEVALVLVSRTAARRTTDARIEALRAAGATIECISLDITASNAVSELAQLHRAQRPFNGVVHAAGIVQDAYLWNKSPAQLRSVLAPKVSGVIALDAASHRWPLDLFLLFGSISGTFGNAGQIDYAAANGFLAGFAERRNEQVTYGERSGRTLCVDWPLWAEGGMRPDEQARIAMKVRSGIEPIATQAAFAALYRAWASQAARVVVISGDVARIGAEVSQQTSLRRCAPAEARAAGVPAPVREAFAAELRRRASRRVKLTEVELDPDRELSAFGFDSISFTELSNELNQAFGLQIVPTLFFEFPTLRSVADHLVAEHAQVLSAKLGAPEAVSASEVVDNEPRAPALVSSMTRNTAEEAIAIVGMSGRFPSADDIESFWRNIDAGRDCIVEVPRSRWDWQAIFGDPRREANRTNVKWGGFAPGVEEFDPLFFGISPRESELIDPQHRLLFMHAWAAIEDAGYAPGSLAGSATGVFVGINDSGYTDLAVQAGIAVDGMAATSKVASMAPNRLSYLLNLHGPSEPAETACSSALVAIHRAVVALRRGECDAALAGGVHVMVTPWAHISFSKAGMLSPDGRCKTFSAQANGYGRGEGIGVFMLKRLTDAQRDRDHVYGLIRASAVNHGGRATSLTAPNPKAQVELLTRAYRDGAVDPRSVTYIEAHGTGTPLGDPIEIDALKRAFAQLDRELDGGARPAEVPCGIGSVKSNIGHLEFAAGAASLAKVLLQLRERVLVPSLHCEEPNPYLGLSNGRFFLVRERQPWHAARDAQGNPLPRRAGISSFGFGGVNAHVVIEEHLVEERPTTTSEHDVAIVLSAKTPAQLEHRIEALIAFLSLDRGLPDLAAMAFTLQCGRDAMEFRFGVVCRSHDELRGKLIQRMMLDESAGVVRMSAAGSDRAVAQEAPSARGASVLSLLQAWCRGEDVDWRQLYANGHPPRVSLPTYPFARERCWIDVPKAGAADDRVSTSDHPLLGTQVRDERGVTFTRVFDGTESFLADHIVNGRRMLPAAAYIEWIRAAFDEWCGEQTRARLTRLVWLRPIVVDTAPVEVALRLDVSGDELAYEVRTVEGRDTAIHARGFVQRGTGTPEVAHDEVQPAQETRTLSGAQCYRSFAAMGLAYGASHQALREVTIERRGPNALRARGTIIADRNFDERFKLPPGALDAVLQTILAAGSAGETASAPALPFAAEAVEIFRAMPRESVAVVTRNRTLDGTATWHAEVYASDGALCIRLRGLAARTLEAPHARPTLRFLQRALRSDGSSGRGTRAVNAEHWILCGPVSQAALERLGIKANLRTWSRPREASAAEVVGTYLEVLRAFVVESLSGAKAPVFLQVVLDGTERAATAAALVAFLRSASQEYATLQAQLVHIEDALIAEDPSWLSCVQADAATGEDVVRYRAGRRLIERTEPLAATQGAAHPWRQNAVYLITGGAGALGAAFTGEILRREPSAKIVLASRRSSNAQIEATLEPLRRLGSVEYLQLDVTDAGEVSGCIAEIERRHGTLHGVLHLAGLVRDGLLRTKTSQQLREVLRPKIDGVAHLDAATAHLPLQFFVSFGSLSGVYGNAGQADYAAANAYLEGFAAERAGLVRAGERHGRSLTIAWPIFAAGGMHMSAAQLRRLREERGTEPLPFDQAFDAFYRAYASGHEQIAVAYEHPVRVDAGVVRMAPERDHAPSGDTDALSRLIARLRQFFAEALKLPVHRIDADTAFVKYGVDSILSLQLTNDLERMFGALPSTVLFDRSDVRSLACYLLERSKDAVGPELDTSGLAEPTIAAGLQPVVSESQKITEHDIAIIGLTGRFPQAGDLAALWANLSAGRDCISEVPAERWSSEEWFAPKGTAGKSYSRWGGFIDGVDEFDPLFFGVAPRDAAGIDPQERLFLQTVWDLLESSGYTRNMIKERHAGNVGLYVGSMYQQYRALVTDAGIAAGLTTSSYSAIANRASHFFGLQGPSLAIDTMCSSAGMAIHLACRDLMNGACEMAIAGGVNLSIAPQKYVGLSQSQVIGSDPASRSFADGDGYQPAECVGTLLLKRRSRALADGDTILAIVKASAANHAGAANAYFVPNPQMHVKLVRDVLAQARWTARDIDYVEAAAAGAALSDAIEVSALTTVFEADGAAPGSCPIGSVKANIGHPEAASTIAQIAKVVLQLQHGMLAPTPLLKAASPRIDFERSPFRLQAALAPWSIAADRQGDAPRPRRALVNSFGAGGSNVALLIEEHTAAPRAMAGTSGASELIVLSARTTQALHARAADLLGFLERTPDVDLADLAYTLQVHREEMDLRLAFVARDIAHARAVLAGYGGGADVPEAGVSSGNVLDADPKLHQVLEGESGDRLLDAACAQRELEKLALLWVQGVRIGWHKLHKIRRRFVTGIPTYAFARERHWLVPANPRLAGLEQDAARAPSVRQKPSDTLTSVTALLAQTLGVDALSLHPRKNILEYGLDSLGAGRLKQAIEAQFGVQLSWRELWSLPTLAALADFVHAQGARRPRSASEIIVPRANIRAVADTSTPALLEGATDEQGQCAPRLRIEDLERFRRGEIDREAIDRLLEG